MRRHYRRRGRHFRKAGPLPTRTLADGPPPDPPDPPDWKPVRPVVPYDLLPESVKALDRQARAAAGDEE